MRAHVGSEQAQAELGPFLRRRRHAIDQSATRLGPYVRLAIRVGKPVTQEEMAEALDVSRQWCAMLEAGTAHATTPLLARISDVLSLSPQDRLELFRLGIPDLDGTLSALDPSVEEAARRFGRLRERFLTLGEIEERGLRPRVARSWIRSRRSGVDASLKIVPLADVPFDELQERNERLLRASLPIVRHLEDQIADTGYAALLTDARGRLLLLHGETPILRRLEKIEAEPGVDGDEPSIGTNAIGMAIADGTPIQLIAGEHFCEGWQEFTCTAAPIRDLQSGEMVGVLDITGPYKMARPQSLGLITDLALEIEEQFAKSGPTRGEGEGGRAVVSSA